MARIEGIYWKEHQNGDPHGMYSFDAFLQAWRVQQACFEEGHEPISLDVQGNGAIYGSGGWHRYGVRSDGEIIFLASFCENPGRVRPLVKQLGFTVWGVWQDHSP